MTRRETGPGDLTPAKVTVVPFPLRYQWKPGMRRVNSASLLKHKTINHLKEAWKKDQDDKSENQNLRYRNQTINMEITSTII